MSPTPSPGAPADAAAHGPADAAGGYVNGNGNGNGAAKTIMGLPQAVFFALLVPIIAAVFAYGVLTARVDATDRDNARQDIVLRGIGEDIKQINQRLLEVLVTLKGPR